MNSKKLCFVWVTTLAIAVLVLQAGCQQASDQASAPGAPATPQAAAPSDQDTGYAVKKPVIGVAGPLAPWGAMGEFVKEVMMPRGWDVQICYYCAGGPREARIVSEAWMAPPPENPTADSFPTPNGPVDFGVTGSQFLWWAYQGVHDFAGDPEGPREHLRMVANIQEPTYLIVAVKADSEITDLHQILEKRLSVQISARVDIGEDLLAYYGLTKESVESLGGQLHIQHAATPEQFKDLDVEIGFGSLVNAPGYNIWYEVSQKYDLRFLELPQDLRAQLARDHDQEEKNIPFGYFRGVDRPIPTVARTGTVIYGRTDMPDDFAYALAKAIDEDQELLQWTHMNFSYNWRTVWKTFGVPLHPGAERYYREVGYME